MRRRRWIMIVKAPVASAARTLDYLAHYMSKVAIGNSRIQRIDLANEAVTFTYRNNQGKKHPWGEIQPRKLDVLRFVDLFLLHALPVRMSRCRPYGFWSSHRKGKDLPEIRRQLGQSAVPAMAEVRRV